MRNRNHQLPRAALVPLLLAALVSAIMAPFGGPGAAAAGLAETSPGAPVAGPAPTLVAALGGPTTPAGPKGAPHIFRPTGPAPRSLDSENLSYHGGPVIGDFTHNVYLIFWGTDWGTNYRTLIGDYFDNLMQASASDKTSNVYYAATQYYRTDVQPTEHASYKQIIAGIYDDNSLAPSTCGDTHGGTLRCYTDGQIQNEVYKAVTARNWPLPPADQVNLNDVYFVFLGNNISECTDIFCSEAFVTDFCAYHDVANVNDRGFLYAALPYAGHNLTHCGSGNYPNNHPAADSELNVTSHEHNEMITDPLGDGWHDSNDAEDGDKCAWTFGPQLGGPAGQQYNQVINGAHYELQREWSNHTTGCVTHGY